MESIDEAKLKSKQKPQKPQKTQTATMEKEATKEQEQKQKQLSKEELIATVKEWIKTDNELTKLKQDVKVKTERKKQLTNALVNVMKSNNIDCFDVNGGALMYTQKKTYKTIGRKFLLSQLNELYSDDIAHEITEKVLSNRPKVLKDEIKRKKSAK